MTFTVHDFQDLIVILEQQPAWRKQLLHVLLPEDFFALPESVLALDQTVDRLGDRVVQLAEGLDQLTARVDSLAKGQVELARAIADLAAAQRVTEERLASLAAVVESGFVQMGRDLASLDARWGQMSGALYESLTRDRAPSVFGTALRRGRDASSAIGDLLHKAVEEGEITAIEQRRVLDSDLLWTGTVPTLGRHVTLTVEASVTVTQDDVERALDRASVLSRLGVNALPVVVGMAWPDYVAEWARRQSVAMVIDKSLDWESWIAAVAGVAASKDGGGSDG